MYYLPTRHADAIWEGDLDTGDGSISVESGALEERYTVQSRFAEGDGTDPEELIGAAHAGCFSMMLAGILSENGYTPEAIHTHTDVTIEENGEAVISRVDLYTDAAVPGIDRETFDELVIEAKNECPVSKALAGVEITVEGELRD